LSLWYRKGLCLQAGKPAIDTLGKTDLRGLLGGDDFLKNFSHLLFHGPAMARCALSGHDLAAIHAAWIAGRALAAGHKGMLLVEGN